MKINQIISETTTAGSVAPVEHAFVKMQTRNPSVYGDKKVGSLLKGKKTNKPFANSINEGAQVDEAKLEEDDIIMIPGQGQRLKPGFHKHDPDKAEHEGQTLKNSLHTIIRVATELDKQLSVQEQFPEWVSEKIGAVKGMMVSVADYLISDEEMEHDPDAMENGVIAGGIAGESRVGNRMSDIQIGSPKIVHYKGKAVGEVGLDHEASPGNGPYYFHHYLTGKAYVGYDTKQQALADLKHIVQQVDAKELEEGAKVDRMVKHIEKSEKKLGHTKKEAENIAWATANKRGMLDNKNKKK